MISLQGNRPLSKPSYYIGAGTLFAASKAGGQERNDMEYRDYYKTLGVKRDATEKEIQKAFRRLARKFHPDLNKGADAEKRFKELNEAYEVLKDPEKRKMYDALGANWQQGQNFRPPPGWENMAGMGGGRRPGGGRRMEFSFGGPGGEFHSTGGGGFSDFFENLFGGGGLGDLFGGGGAAGPESMRGGPRPGQGFPGGMGGMHGFGQPAAPEAVEVELEVSLEDAHHGATQTITLTGGAAEPKRLQITIPKGARDGQKMRLKGQGGNGADLHLKLKLRDHRVFRRDGEDLEVDVPLKAWQAALGGKVEVPTLDGPVLLTVPAGSSSGRKMRLRGKGLHKKGGSRGDLMAVFQVEVPKKLSAEEKELYERLRDLDAE